MTDSFELDFHDFGKLTDTFRHPDLIERLSDNQFATLLRETKRFAETRWSPKMRRSDASDTSGITALIYLPQVRNGGRPEISVHASDGEGLDKEWKENHRED